MKIFLLRFVNVRARDVKIDIKILEVERVPIQENLKDGGKREAPERACAVPY